MGMGLTEPVWLHFFFQVDDNTRHKTCLSELIIPQKVGHLPSEVNIITRFVMAWPPWDLKER